METTAKETKTRVAVTRPGKKLATVAGYTEGVVAVHPTTVQCVDCLACFTSKSTLFAVSSAVFNPRSGYEGRRCSDCWKLAGWTHTASSGWSRS